MLRFLKPNSHAGFSHKWGAKVGVCVPVFEQLY